MELTRFELTEAQFESFRKLIMDASGIFFDRGKAELLKLGLSDRAGAVEAGSLDEYYELITRSPERELEMRRLLAHLSVGETTFFRNLPQFDALRKYAIPDIVRSKAAAGNRVLRFWSAGCSTGQEPYSIAMSLLDVLPDAASWSIEVLGTDLSDEALKTAERGWYQERQLGGIDRDHLRRYFREQDGGYVVAEPVRRLVKFRHHNMVTDALPIVEFGTCDFVFCRNVIIYFNQETAKYVVELFYDIMNPGGYLFLGHSETLWRMSAKYSLVEVGDAFIYRKSLPRSLEGRRFIPDRRMRDTGLPQGVIQERRTRSRRRSPEQVTSTPTPSGEEPRAGAAADPIPQWLAEARLLLNMGERDAAREKLAAVIAADSTCVTAHFLLGLACEECGDLETAAEEFRRALYLDDSHSLACFHLASVMEQDGRLKSAVRYFRNAADCFRREAPGRWEQELDAYEAESLVSLCEWKLENLGALES